MTDVTWRPHPLDPVIEASTEGDIRVTDRLVTDTTGRCTRLYRGRVLKPYPSRNGYLRLSMSRDGRKFSIGVHKLVCEAFHGLQPAPDLEIRHLNGVNTDNRPENLRWGTKIENAADRLSHGTHNNASKTHCKRGHEFTPENTYIRKAGLAGTGGRGDGRNCLACKRQQERDRYRAKVGRPVRYLSPRLVDGVARPEHG